MRSRFFTMAVINKNVKAVAFCGIYVIPVVKYRIKNFVFSGNLQQLCFY